ncbi:hypothetical protein [Paenibacillus sp. M-152]|uniref:hypothetical protein n=1 Tax=Paenibacillus sp. M-152 TaxID=2487928 RepID=UPI000F704EF6|nr:hypothetical protein [Paenibacillus sp. M-152]AZH31301.1 hypothetical protein EGM68_22390 [Paenibacillus sp. M-152]
MGQTEWKGRGIVEYFLCQHDDRMLYAAVPVWDEEANAEMMDLNDWTNWPASYAAQFKVNGHDYTVYPDILMGSRMMVSDAVHELLQVFVPGLFSRMALLRDMERSQQKLYWMIQPPLVDCLGEQSQFRPGGTLMKLVVDRERTKGKSLLQVQGLRETYTLVNLALAESLLRRGTSGITFQEVAMQ